MHILRDVARGLHERRSRVDSRLQTLEGQLAIGELPLVVRDLWKARASGTLLLWNGDARKRIVFKNGDVVFAATNVEEERLGQRLVRARKISRSVRDLALRVMKRSHERFGTTIVEWGWVNRTEMQRRVAIQIKDIISSVFAWDAGEYRFEHANEPVPPDLALALHTAEVIYEGARRISDIATVRARLGSTSQLLKLARGKRLTIPVTHEDGFMLSGVDGLSSIEAVVGGSPFEEDETLRRIYALVLAGVLELADAHGPISMATSPDQTSKERKASEEEKRFRAGVEAWHAALQFGSFYDRLRVEPEASGMQIRKAYVEAMTLLEPEPRFRDQIEDLRPRLEKVERKLLQAYEVLSAPERRREYDRLLSEASPEATVAGPRITSQTQAVSKIQPNSSGTVVAGSSGKKEQAALDYVEAKRLHSDGAYFDAIAALNEALQLDPENAHYHCLMAQWLAQNPDCWRASQQHFARAIELDARDEGRDHTSTDEDFWVVERSYYK